MRIAYATAGQGPPLVKTANYLTHLEHDWESPVWAHWLGELARHHTLVRYDERGSGLSDWEVGDFAMDGWVSDLEAVADAAGLDRFALLGLSQGAAVAVAYAARHPERVSHLVLYGGYARGRLVRARSPEDELEAETMINVIRVGWGRDNPAFRQLFGTLLMPDAGEEQKRWLDRLAQVSTTPENAAAMERAFYRIDVTDEARAVEAPTLVVHARDDAAVPFAAGRELAALVPGSRFVPLDSRNHVLAADEPAWSRFVAELHGFLGVVGPLEASVAGAAEAARQAFPELTPRERDVLDLLARGLDNEAIAGRLFVTPKTVRNYVSAIYDKLAVPSRAKAIVLAREAGLGRSGD